VAKPSLIRVGKMEIEKMSNCRVCGKEKSDEIKESVIHGEHKKCGNCGQIYTMKNGTEYKLVESDIQKNGIIPKPTGISSID